MRTDLFTAKGNKDRSLSSANNLGVFFLMGVSLGLGRSGATSGRTLVCVTGLFTAVGLPNRVIHDS
jgi:hypothetical protein